MGVDVEIADLIVMGMWAQPCPRSSAVDHDLLRGGVAAAPERYGEVSLTRIAFVWGVNVKSSNAWSREGNARSRPCKRRADMASAPWPLLLAL